MAQLLLLVFSSLDLYSYFPPVSKYSSALTLCQTLSACADTRRYSSHKPVPLGYLDSVIAEFIAKSSKLRNFRKGSQIFVIAADFPQILGLDASRVIASAFSQRQLVSQFEKWNEQPAFSLCPIYKSYIGQTNRKRNKSVLLVWATDRLSALARAAGCSPSRDIVTHSAGRYSEESSLVKLAAESITSLSNLMRSIQIRCRILLKLRISELGVDRLSAWPIIGADIKHFTDYRYRPF